MEFFENIKQIFQSFAVINAVEIFLFALAFYYVFRIFKNNNLRSLIVVFTILVILSGVVFLFNDKLRTDLFIVIPLIFVGVVMVVFNVEVKRDILSMNVFNRPEKGGGQISVSRDEVERYVSEIIKALQNLSKDNIGSLIILANDNVPPQVLESGVILDAKISSQLIEGIFFPKAPLHDGAMIVNNYKIQAAGCFLPLTQNVNIPKELGTRHRAGIGITETADVIALIVSEETGIITVAQRGKISRYADYDLLRRTLNEYYWKDLGADGRKRI